MNIGYIKQYRKELESDIWLMPPLYGRVWKWVLLKAKWKPEIFPTPNGMGIHINPGQFLTSYDNIANGVKWYEWGREKIPNKKTIKTILDWLATQNMVTVVSNGKGTLISIVNWDTYQIVDIGKVTEESNDDGNKEKLLLETIKELKKNLKELKDNKEDKTKPFRALDFLLSLEVEKKIAQDWLKVRQKKKAANTETAFKRIKTEIDKTKKTANEIIEMCCEKSWSGFKASWLENQKDNGADKVKKKCDSGCSSFPSCKGNNVLKLGQEVNCYCLPDNARR